MRALAQGSPRATALAAAVLFASGCSALAFQILWVQQAGLWLGQESAAVLAVVAAFFGGLALGALLSSRLLARSRHPARLYALCEVLVAAWALVLIALLQPVAALLARHTGVESSPLQQWLIAFSGTLLLLLPGTAAMGATLPAMDRALQALGSRRGFGLLYTANTGGAMLGTLGAAFWLLPQWGLTRTALCCGLVNLACAGAALLLPRGSMSLPQTASPSFNTAARGGLHFSPAVLLFATGLLGIAFELAIVRALSQLAQNTVYTYALLLAVYLAGTTLGAAAQRHIGGTQTAASRRTALLCGLAFTTALALPLLGVAPQVQAWLQTALPATAASALGIEALLAALAFLPATFMMGLTFTQLVHDAQREGLNAGPALAANTFGGSLAAPLLSLALLPLAGLRGALLAIPGGYLLLAARSRWAWAGAAALAALAWLMPPLNLSLQPAGTQQLAFWEGRRGTVSVLESADGVRTLHIDNRQQEGSNVSTYADARQALLPLLLNSAPHRALFLGVGTGVTAGAATLDPGLQVDAVELMPEVLRATTWFDAALPAGADRARLHFIAADARRFVQAGFQPYDIIVADNFHPARSGTGALYAREHFAQVRQRLASDGLFCQWLPLHQLDLPSLASIVHSFTDVFPDAIAILATNSLDTPTLGLLAWRHGPHLNAREVQARLAALPDSARAAFDLPDAMAVLGTVVAGPDSLRAFASGAPANTDDRPIVSYRAPFETYAPQSLPRDRLLQLVDTWHAAPIDVLPATEDASDWPPRLQHYWAARNQYLHAGRNVKPVAGLLPMLQQVREPLLAVLRISPEFRPAYEPLARMARALAVSDPEAGQALWADLAAVRPPASDQAGVTSGTRGK